MSCHNRVGRERDMRIHFAIDDYHLKGRKICKLMIIKDFKVFVCIERVYSTTFRNCGVYSCS